MRKLDFSLGDPLLPLTYVANYAFRKAGKDLQKYRVIGQTSLGDELGKIHAPISQYFTARGMHSAGWSGLTTKGLLITNGTTEAFEQIMRALADDVKRRWDEHGQEIIPVILMPVPTYGFFADTAAKHNLEVVKIERDLDNGGRLDRAKIIEAIKETRAQGKRIVAYFDSNPNNPTGLIRGENETKEIARIINGLSHIYEREDEEWNKSTHGFRYEGLTSRVKIIDDMVYDGLEYESSEKPYAFAQLRGEHDVFRDTFTLFGASKAGLAALRVGVAIGPDEILTPLRRNMQSTGYFPPMTAYHASAAYFSTDTKFIAKRQNHLSALNKEHEIRGKLMKCLINGRDQVPEITETDFSKITAVVHAETKDPAQIFDLLRTGIKGIKVITTPQSGFFHLLDFNDLKGIEYDRQAFSRGFGQNRYGMDCRIEDAFDLDRLLDIAEIDLAASSWMELEQDRFIERATFAKPFGEIIEMCSRLKKLSDFLHLAPERAVSSQPEFIPT